MNTSLSLGLVLLANAGVLPAIYFPLPFYVGLIKKGKLSIAIILLIFLIAMFIGMGYFAAVFNITWLFLLYPILIVPLTVANLSKSRAAFQVSDSLSRQNKTWFWAGGLLILALQLVPAAAVFYLPTYCMDQEQERTTNLVSTIHIYSEANGALPRSIEQLTSAFPVEIPKPACSGLPGQSGRRFEIYQNAEYHFVQVQSINRYSCEIYNIEMNQWFLTDTFEVPCR